MGLAHGYDNHEVSAGLTLTSLQYAHLYVHIVIRLADLTYNVGISLCSPVANLLNTKEQQLTYCIYTCTFASSGLFIRSFLRLKPSAPN